MIGASATRWVGIIAVAGMLYGPSGGEAAELILAEKGRCDYQVVVPDASPTPAIGEALNQVARLVQSAFQANGCEVPVVSEGKRDAARPCIYLGNTAFARTHGVETFHLAGWGYVLKTVGREVIIAGNDQPAPSGPDPNPRRAWDRVGTAKGVVDFLRQYVGVRFLYPDLPPWTPISSAAPVDFLTSPSIEFLPVTKIAIPTDLHIQKTPCLEYNVGYPQQGSFYDIALNRFPLVDVRVGAHTYERACPPEKYRQSHPEYFALLGGNRTEKGQYCISNPGFQELLYQDMIGELDQGFSMVDLGQPDGFQACQCENCKKLFGTGDDWSEKLWILHRNLAERALKERPGKKVMMLSYMLTETPPKTFKRFPENTVIMLCGTNEEDLAPWREVEVPGGFTGYIYTWCPNLVTRYTPMATPRSAATQVKHLYAHRTRGLYRDGPGQLYGLEGPIYYLMGRMFDAPETLHGKELMQEFLEGAFGKAAVPMQAFYDMLYHGLEVYSEFLGTRRPGWFYRDLYGNSRKYLTDPFQLIGFLYPPTLLESLEKELSRAEKLADTEKIKARLALVRREFDYLKALARVVHLYQAYQIQPDMASRHRLLDAIEDRNALIASFYTREQGRPAIGEWVSRFFPPPGHDANHLRLAYDRYQEPYAGTCLNWDTKAMRTAPLLGAETQPPSSALKQVREKLYAESFEVPAAWKQLPNLLPLTLWLFKKDPLEHGVRDNWFQIDLDETDWIPVEVPSFWAESEDVGDYQGYAWYRTTFEVPAEWQGRSLQLLFGAADEQAWVYVNGRLIQEHTLASTGLTLDTIWETPFTVEVPPERIRYGEKNLLAVRVYNSIANGGLWRPVLAHAVATRP